MTMGRATSPPIAPRATCRRPVRRRRINGFTSIWRPTKARRDELAFDEVERDEGRSRSEGEGAVIGGNSGSQQGRC